MEKGKDHLNKKKSSPLIPVRCIYLPATPRDRRLSFSLSYPPAGRRARERRERGEREGRGRVLNLPRFPSSRSSSSLISSGSAMESPKQTPAPPACDSELLVAQKDGGSPSQVDPFLVEALENPRHRLTVLRMELDIQRFMRNPDQHQFEFQHFPTSYLRCAAHRVAQHYGLQTMLVLDSIIDGSGKIVVCKTPESRFPAICLSDIPAKQPENDKSEQIKIVIRPRPNKASQNDTDGLGLKRSPVRTMEERKEEYDRARARIFNGSNSTELEGPASHASADGKSLCLNIDDTEYLRNSTEEREKISAKDGASRVAAIFRDREKDRTDPDYDRSYDRYSRGVMPNQSFSMGQYNMLQNPFVQYEKGFPQLGQLPRAQTSVGYRPPNHIMTPYNSVGCNQTSRDAVYMQWPSQAMVYAHSYEHFRHGSFQVPFHQQALSFENYQNR